MNRTVLGIVIGVGALIIAVPIVIALFLYPLRVETVDGGGNNNLVPSDLEALTVHDRLSIQLTWTAVDQGTATYVLQRSEGGEEESWEDLVELDPGATSYLDSDNLMDGVTYQYRIYAHDPEGGAGYSNAASAMATALPVPGGLTQEELGRLQAELDENVQKWQQAALSDYTFEFRVNCFCPEDIRAPLSIKVRNTNTIDSVSYVESGEPVTEHLDIYLTVGGMFDTIQEAIDTRVASLTVSYDPELGYPTEVFVDRDFMIADEERGFTAQGLEVIQPPTLEKTQSQLNSSRELWEASGPASYEIEYRRICFCPQEITAPVVVVVNDGVIESRTYVESGQPVGEAMQDFFVDVPGMFDLIQEAIDQQAAQIRVAYDPDLGYPVDISIDYNFMMADEEVYFTVSRLE